MGYPSATHGLPIAYAWDAYGLHGLPTRCHTLPMGCPRDARGMSMGYSWATLGLVRGLPMGS